MLEQFYEFEPKGSKNVPSMQIAKQLWDLIYNGCIERRTVYFTNNIDLFAKVRKGLWKHLYIYVYYPCDGSDDYNLGHLITQGRIISASVTYLLLESSIKDRIGKDVRNALLNLRETVNKIPSKDYELISNPTLDLHDTLICRPMDVRRAFKQAIMKDFDTKEKLQDFINKNGLITSNKPQPLHIDKTTKANEIVKLDNCVYMDIHKAHAGFNLDVFKNYNNTEALVKKHLDLAVKYKKQGDKVKAKYHKDFNNLSVGCYAKYNKDEFGHKTCEGNDWIYEGVLLEPLYWACVKQTREKIDNQILNLKQPLGCEPSKVMYANTDGFIMHNPDWSKVKHSDVIGEFGIEDVKDNTFYFYNYQSTDNKTTNYSIHQWYDNKGEKHIVGNLPNELKELIDLSIGKVVEFKTTVDKLGVHHYENVKEIIKK